MKKLFLFRENEGKKVERNEANISINGEMTIKSASILMGKTIGAMLSHLGGINTTTPSVEMVCEYFSAGVVNAIKEASAT